MGEVASGGVSLHVEVDGEGDPVTVLAHGITNSCRELALFTPLLRGAKVRFCFRGHGHSSLAPVGSYGFAHLAGDLDAVARAHGATRAVGTSMGAGALCRLLAGDPGRFERIVLLLPAGLDGRFRAPERFLRIADLLESMEREEAVEAILADPERQAAYDRAPWLRDVDRSLWSEINPAGVSAAIREVMSDRPMEDREALRAVEAPVLIIAREGDSIHPAGVAREMAELLPNAQVVMFADEVDMFERIPLVVQRATEFLES
ncbi:MAG: alpha/beta hydrolase [Actinobacteria bacterium]|nr:alpha/beta hydrolase [Actinomycetota bacterium]